MKILVTGGTGHLGRALIPHPLQRGHQVRVLARHAGTSAEVEWAEGDLATGRGLAEAVAGADIVIHAATSSPIAQRGQFRVVDFFRSPADVDVEGTRALLQLAATHRVSHFVQVSIVGLEDTKRLPYSRVKLAAEDAVRRSPVPWSILRATTFYWLLHRLVMNMTRGPLIVIPAELRMQPVDSDDFARWVADCATDGNRGRREDFAGPQVLAMREIVTQFLAASGRRSSTIHNLPLPRALRAALERGQVASPGAHLGSTTWQQWLLT